MKNNKLINKLIKRKQLICLEDVPRSLQRAIGVSPAPRSSIRAHNVNWIGKEPFWWESKKWGTVQYIQPDKVYEFTTNGYPVLLEYYDMWFIITDVAFSSICSSCDFNATSFIRIFHGGSLTEVLMKAELYEPIPSERVERPSMGLYRAISAL